MTSKLDYLKKYMDGGSQKSDGKLKKKRKKLPNTLKHNIKIFDSQAETFSRDENKEYEEFDLKEEKPILYAEDGTTILTKEFEEQEKKKKSSWKTFESKNNAPARKRHDSSGSEDLSPQRPTRRRHDSDGSDLSPPRSKNGKNSNDSDVSPPRKRRQRHDSSASSDLSPERPSRKGKGSDSDLSPQRNRRPSDSDLSPDRDTSKDKSSKKRRREEMPEIISIAKKAGLQSASELKKENDLRRQQEREKFKNLDQSVSGKGADTIHRDRKSGKKIDIKLEELKKRRAEEEKSMETEKHALWGRGVAQEKQHQQKLEDALHEISKPLARYKGDKDLEDMLKDQAREGDPMLAYMSKKKAKVDRNVPVKPKYKGANPPPNRFNIWPGYRYDGVDRSNGFEKQRFATINQMKTFNEAKHKWSVEDM